MPSGYEWNKPILQFPGPHKGWNAPKIQWIHSLVSISYISHFAVLSKKWPVTVAEMLIYLLKFTIMEW